MGRGGARPNTGPVPLKVVTLPTRDPKSIPADVGPWRGMLTEKAAVLYRLLREAACGTRRLTIAEMTVRLRVHHRSLPFLFWELGDLTFIHIVAEREKNRLMPSVVLLFGPPEPPDVKEEARLTLDLLQREHVGGAAFIDWYRERYEDRHGEPLKVQRWHYGQAGRFVSRCGGLREAQAVAGIALARFTKLSIGGLIARYEDLMSVLGEEREGQRFTPVPTIEADRIRDQLLVASYKFGGDARKVLARWTAADIQEVYECSPRIAEMAIERIQKRLAGRRQPPPLLDEDGDFPPPSPTAKRKAKELLGTPQEE